MATAGMVWWSLLVLCEIFESSWQRAPTLLGVLERVRHWYRDNIFLLFVMHPSFWLLLYLYMAGVRGAIMAMVLVMKAADIAFKLWMVDKWEKGALPSDFVAMLHTPLASWMAWLNVAIYPSLVGMVLWNTEGSTTFF